MNVCFRPQQGLTIMNYYESVDEYEKWLFPSPTGVNHYEYVERELLENLNTVSVPNRG